MTTLRTTRLENATCCSSEDDFLSQMGGCCGSLALLLPFVESRNGRESTKGLIARALLRVELEAWAQGGVVSQVGTDSRYMVRGMRRVAHCMDEKERWTLDWKTDVYRVLKLNE